MGKRPSPGLIWTGRVIAVSLAVRVVALVGPNRSGAILDRCTRRPMRAVEVDTVARCVDQVARWGHGLAGGCLVRGMTLYYFLRRMSHDVTLQFGVGEVAGRIEGHCWLVLDGEPFLEKQDPRDVFREIYRLPIAGRPR